MRQVSDRGYRKLFKNKTIFRQLMQTFVHEDWVQELDFNSCETLDKSFIADHYKETVSDLVYKIKLRGKEIFIIVLMEFKSEVERFMSVGLANYVGNFYMDYVASHKRIRKLPPVFPILLYSGSRKWNAPESLTDLIEGEEYLGDYGLRFKYFKIAANAFSKRRLLAIKNVVSTLFLVEGHYDLELLKKELADLYSRESDRAAVSLLLNWFLQLLKHGRIPPQASEALEHVFDSSKEVRQMLEVALQKERRGYFNEGKREGKREAERKSRREIALKMIAKGFELALIAEVTGLSEVALRRLKLEKPKK
ncbi:Rpn family recombination-promoting nuclease/putative transposase [candidate division KSB1 bacterium]|nr:Rpn family recombination-promoting nuclease/putative transposase [candidate division KSB1 bacterium]